MQDVHWYTRQIGGMFQGYTLGNLMSAQFFDAAVAAHPEIPDRIERQWIEKLDPKMSGFFSQIHEKKELDDRLKVCQSIHEVIALAQECGVKLSEDELKQAAVVAETIPGFSFEKLWFRGLGSID